MKPEALLDSSVWIELLNKGRLGGVCEKLLSTHQITAVPTIVIFEVYRKIKSAYPDPVALSTVAYLKQFGILEFTLETALLAADLSVEFKLAMADSSVLAHAYLANVKLITLDNDFSGIENVTIIRN